MMPVVLWTVGPVWLLVAITIGYFAYVRKHEHLAAPWRRVARSTPGMAALVVLLAFVAIGLLDSLHFRPVLEGKDQKGAPVYRMFEDGKVPQRASEQKVEKWEPAPVSREGLSSPARERFSDTGGLTREEIAAGRKLLRERRGPGAFSEDETTRTQVEAPPREYFPEAKGVDKPAQVEKGALKIFGHELFAWPASTLGPITQVPVSNDYVVGPGDEIKVLMWGRMDSDYSLVVNAEGVIHLPILGPLVVLVSPAADP